MLLRLYDCPLRVLRWCVLSFYEKEKCRLMKSAFAQKNIKPDIDCVSAKNAMECMSKIRQGIADITTLDAADAYRAQRYYQLIPLAAEDYGVDMESNVMYAVAVAKRTDLTTNLWNLRGKTICSTAIGDLAGWHVPIDYLSAIKETYVTNCHVNKVAGKENDRERKREEESLGRMFRRIFWSKLCSGCIGFRLQSIEDQSSFSLFEMLFQRIGLLFTFAKRNVLRKFRSISMLN